jgi:hypothetical protein
MIKHVGAVCILGAIALGTTALSPVAAGSRQGEVRVGNKKPSIGAQAHTGSEVHIKKPTKLIPHETTHVIQQTKGHK